MDESIRQLSKVIHWTKYARHIPHKSRRETYLETIQRNENMHFARFSRELEPEDFAELDPKIQEAYALVREKKILPSMRSMQFAGEAIMRNNARLYNCAYLPIKDVEAFREVMFLLLSGCGVGFSVQKRHVGELPRLRKPKDREKYVIADSIEGWADAVDALMRCYLYGTTKPVFDYSMIRPRGSILRVSGGKAPGYAPLKKTLCKIEEILESSLYNGGSLRTVDAHDICCFIADAVLSGGIRRSACISLFSHDDDEMMSCKNPENIKNNFQRYRANNSVVFHRSHTSKSMFDRVWEVASIKGSGEPGIYWTDDFEYGTNPCAEIALRPYQFCNLVEINGAEIHSQEQLDHAARMAARIATLQASYTDFSYLRNQWKKTTESEALIGVGITGIVSGNTMNLDLQRAAKIVKEENMEISNILGINPSARSTTIKPSGTTSSLLGCSSGVHAWHSEYYLRNVRFNKMEPIAEYLQKRLPFLCNDNVVKEDEIVVSFPMAAPENKPTRASESTFEFLERVFKLNMEWVRGGYRQGGMNNNVSATANIKPGEEVEVGEYLWTNRHRYNGISVFPYSDHVYPQAPFEECDRETYEKYLSHVENIDLTDIIEEHDNTDLMGEIACAGGACEI